MRILVNASVLKGGGGLQVAHSFVNELKGFPSNKYYVVCSLRLKNFLDIEKFPDNFFFYFIDPSPSDFRRGRKSVNHLKKIEADFKPDVVFTIFGPSYWRPKAPHVCGYALPHFVYADSPFFDIITLKEKIRWKMLEYIKLAFFSKDSDHFIVETKDVAVRLAKKLKISEKRVSTVENAYNAVFDNPEEWRSFFIETGERSLGFKLLTISAFYKHKNLSIIPAVVDYLCEHYPDFDFVFILTIEKGIFKNLSQQQRKHILFLGPVKIDECPELYRQSDALFMPTLLECFTVSYLEAMKMGKPILTSNLSFARDICQDSAFYFDPMDAVDIGDKIVKLAGDHELQTSLIERGDERLKDFGTATDRARSYLKVLEEIAQDKKHKFSQCSTTKPS